MAMKLAASTTLACMKTLLTDRRHMGERRWGLAFDFPIRDSHGVLVIQNRRSRPDRRLDNTTLEERLLMFTGAVPVEKDNKQRQG